VQKATVWEMGLVFPLLDGACACLSDGRRLDVAGPRAHSDHDV
jgi:hypothetical protein